MSIKFDKRWVGEHGIGRFSAEIYKNIEMDTLKISGSPSSPFDIFRLFFAMLIHTKKSDIVFSPGYNIPFCVLRPYIFTIHDLNHIDLDLNSSFLKKIYYRLFVMNACKKAYRIITVSEFSKQRIIKWSGVDAKRVVNVSSGVNSDYYYTIKPHNLGYKYILCISNRKPHKNEPRIIEAFATSGVDVSIKLVFNGTITDDIRSVIKKNNLIDRVVFLGRIPESELPGIYKGAIALVFPSLYEGFGLPVVEAMACGTPVLTSNITSLPEIAGDAAILVNPYSIEEISAGIKMLCNMPDLRDELILKGLNRAKLYRWEDVCKNVSNVLKEYEQCLS